MERTAHMSKKVGSFKELAEFVQSFGIGESEAIHIAESFMDKNKIDFDADGNFTPLDVDFSKDSNEITKT
jgi:hypothetical protein